MKTTMNVKIGSYECENWFESDEHETLIRRTIETKIYQDEIYPECPSARSFC